MDKPENRNDGFFVKIVDKWSGLSRRGKVIVIFVGLFLLILGTFENKSKSSSNNISSRSGEPEWNILCGNVYPGVKVYYGIDKSYWGTVLDSNGDYVKVRMSNGSVELKDRSAVICGGGNIRNIQLFIRRDDPALR